MMKPYTLANTSFNIILALFVLITFISCGGDVDLEGHYINKSFDRSKELNQIQFANQSIQAAPVPFEKDYFIDFFSNGTYTMNSSRFEFGSFDYRAGKIFLYPEGRDKWELGYKWNEKAEVAQFTFPKASSDQEKSVTLSKMEHQYKADYPYSKELNLWRVKASKELSNNELIEKLQNNLEFTKAYMTWSSKVDLDLDLKYMSGPLRYSNSGFSMRRLSSTGKWCDYFVEGDCQELDYIIRNVFDKLEIEWNHTHNRVAMLGDGLAQLINNLNNQKENFDQ